MARKKKTAKQINTDLTTTQAQRLAYQGKVKVQILHGDKVVSTKNYTNNGLKPLFKYISHTLAGNYYSDLRPCKIALYNCLKTGIGETYESPNNFNWEEVKDKTGDLVQASPYVVYDATPIVKENQDSYSTTFRFKIPFYWLYLKTFNTIGLYTEGGEACAYYLFVKTENDTKKWDTQILDNVTGNYSLIIEWTMEVSNK